MKTWLFLLIGTMLGLFPGGDGPDRNLKIAGVSLVAPVNQVDDSWVTPVQRLNAGWVAILPYAYCYPGRTHLVYDIPRQWWGERVEGVRATLRHARQKGLKVLLKPMVWIPGGWPGDFDLGTDQRWTEWEANYSRYILDLARVATEEKADMLCLGTEFKLSAANRPGFWRQLATQVREVFPGKITYAANWDNYHNISFWADLDYIGIDAYFPLSEDKLPLASDLKCQWGPLIKEIRDFSQKYERPVLFTEFGYRSVDQCTWRQWELERIPHHHQVNLQAQLNAYQAFFESFWEEEWFAGLFLWQWYHYYDRAGGHDNSDYTPQNKPAEALIREWYGKS